MASISSVSSLSNLSAKTGIGGLASGMDIDELVYNLTATSRNKILKQQQNIQRLEWKQTAYRSVSTALKEFQSKYLDVLSTTNFRNSALYNTVKAASSSDAVTAASTSNATAGTITIESITRLATSQTIKGTTAASKALSGSLSGSGEGGALTSGDIDMLAGNLQGQSISVNLDGTTKTITFGASFIQDLYEFSAPPTAEGLEQAFQNALDKAFGTYTDPDSGETKSMVTADISETTGILSFSTSGSKLTVYNVGDEADPLGFLGLTSGQSNKVSTSASIGDLSLAAGLEDRETYVFTINSVQITANKTDSLATVMNKINASKAGVTVSYSSITDQFTMTSKVSGSGENILISESQGNLMEALGLTGDNSSVEYGTNAMLRVNGQDIVRSSNTFEIDGVKLTLNSTSSEAVTITTQQDASDLVDTIKKFVEDYNAMMDLTNGLVKEKQYRDYTPLSDEQKDEMSESEIEKWEETAKSGILRGDSILNSISSKMNSLMTGFSLNGVSLYTMGITSAGYTENGKLEINEEKLKEALETHGNEIKELFTSEDGISNQLNDIITGAIKTSGPQGSRGTLVEAAGVESTMSDTENYITEAIERTNKTITTLQTRLTSEETRLWNKFTAMETALQRLNTQSSILSQFTSNGNS